MNTVDQSTAVKTKQISILGVIVTIAVTVGFLWAASQWLNRNSTESKSAIQTNERSGFSNIQRISQAQQKYIQTDWDKNGKKTYAMYFVHLWTSVNDKGDQIHVNLIPRQLGFATEAARAVDGYYFYDVHDHMVQGTGTLVPFNYEKEWAVLAMPALNGQTGMLNYLADYSGNIYVNSAKYIATQYPEDPVHSGWTKIDNLEQLAAFQKNIVYP